MHQVGARPGRCPRLVNSFANDTRCLLRAMASLVIACCHRNVCRRRQGHSPGQAQMRDGQKSRVETGEIWSAHTGLSEQVVQVFRWVLGEWRSNSWDADCRAGKGRRLPLSEGTLHQDVDVGLCAQRQNIRLKLQYLLTTLFIHYATLPISNVIRISSAECGSHPSLG